MKSLGNSVDTLLLQSVIALSIYGPQSLWYQGL